MLKPILLGSALLLSIPALAQTTGGTAGQGTATTTNDHDPTMEDDATAQGTANATVATQVNGGTTSASTNTGAGADAPGTMNDQPMQNGTATSHQGMNHGTAAQGTTGHSGMNHGTASQGTTGHSGMNHGTAASQGATGHSGMNHGTAAGQGTMSGEGAMSGQGTMSGQAGMSASGAGGPFQAARDYPPCSRTVTDSCIQTYERGRRR
jgi:hypothetical protein